MGSQVVCTQTGKVLHLSSEVGDPLAYLDRNPVHFEVCESQQTWIGRCGRLRRTLGHDSRRISRQRQISLPEISKVLGIVDTSIAMDDPRVPAEGGMTTDTPHLVTAINFGDGNMALGTRLGVVAQHLDSGYQVRVAFVLVDFRFQTASTDPSVAERTFVASQSTSAVGGWARSDGFRGPCNCVRVRISRVRQHLSQILGALTPLSRVSIELDQRVSHLRQLISCVPE